MLTQKSAVSTSDSMCAGAQRFRKFRVSETIQIAKRGKLMYCMIRATLHRDDDRERL